jgi:hypothetical protein
MSLSIHADQQHPKKLNQPAVESASVPLVAGILHSTGCQAMTPLLAGELHSQELYRYTCNEYWMGHGVTHVIKTGMLCYMHAAAHQHAIKGTLSKQ